MAGDTKTPLPQTPLPSRKSELMMAELMVERVHIPRPPFAEKVMSDNRLIDIVEIKPDSGGSSEGAPRPAGQDGD